MLCDGIVAVKSLLCRTVLKHVVVIPTCVCCCYMYMCVHVHVLYMYVTTSTHSCICSCYATSLLRYFSAVAMTVCLLCCRRAEVATPGLGGACAGRADRCCDVTRRSSSWRCVRRTLVEVSASVSCPLKFVLSRPME